VAGEVPVRNLGSPVRATQIPKQAPQWPIPEPCKVSPNFQLSKMSCNWHTSFRNAFYMTLHDVHVHSHTDHMDIAEWSCGFCIMVVYIIEISANSTCLHPVFRPPFTP
jgi:hypothetical protein